MDDSHILNDHDELNSMIGRGTRFKGEFDLEGLLRIDGDFSGVIRTSGKVLIGSNGRAECSLYAGRVVIGGIIKGEIISREKVTILSTGMVIGNISTPRLIVEEGVIFNGTCRITRNTDPPAKEKYPVTENSPEIELTKEPGLPKQLISSNPVTNEDHSPTQQPEVAEKQYFESWRK